VDEAFLMIAPASESLQHGFVGGELVLYKVNEHSRKHQATISKYSLGNRPFFIFHPPLSNNC
jgi:hypothetical protein